MLKILSLNKIQNQNLSSESLILHGYSDLSFEKVALLVPGLGMPKTELFYFYHELAKELFKNNISAYMIDLEGQGEAKGEISLKKWEIQLKIILENFKERDVITISRGLSSYLLTKIKLKNKIKMISLNCFQPSIYSKYISQIEWIKHSYIDNSISVNINLNQPEEEIFWSNLGTEYSSLGQISLPIDFTKQVEDLMKRNNLNNNFLNLSTKQYFNNDDFLINNIFSNVLENFGPLFDKSIERKEIIKIILSLI